MSGGEPIVEDKKTGDPLWIDLREITLRYVLPVSGVKRFFEGLKEGKLLATRCPKCGAKFFPPQPDCPECGSSEVEWFETSGEGVLLSYTVINVKPESFSKYPDYIVGVARLDDGVNVIAWVRDAEPGSLRRGMRVRVESEKREDGSYSYYIKPAGSP